MKKKSLMSPGVCIGVRVNARLFAACRVTGLHKAAPVIEIVEWQGTELPSVDAVKRAKKARLAELTAGFERGPLRFVFMDPSSTLPADFFIVGNEASIARKGSVPHLGLGWRDLRKAIVVAAATIKKVDAVAAIDRDEARSARIEGRKTDLTPALWRLRENAREVAAMWRNDEYDNLKDVVADLSSLLPKVRAKLPKEAAALERMTRAVLRNLAKDPDYATDAKTWATRLRTL